MLTASIVKITFNLKDSVDNVFHCVPRPGKMRSLIFTLSHHIMKMLGMASKSHFLLIQFFSLNAQQLHPHWFMKAVWNSTNFFPTFSISSSGGKKVVLK
mmetsp:Transcript_11114/g.41515  ORF Transcript_11114/g.41515 Transcript_11114/m.41515 type:complete len:99 (-) Transcript_11114:1431-1727(-)